MAGNGRGGRLCVRVGAQSGTYGGMEAARNARRNEIPFEIFAEKDENGPWNSKKRVKSSDLSVCTKVKRSGVALPYDFELGYVLAEPYWGRGLVPEAARRALAFAFED